MFKVALILVLLCEKVILLRLVSAAWALNGRESCCVMVCQCDFTYEAEPQAAGWAVHEVFGNTISF